MSSSHKNGRSGSPYPRASRRNGPIDSPPDPETVGNTRRNRRQEGAHVVPPASVGGYHRSSAIQGRKSSSGNSVTFSDTRHYSTSPPEWWLDPISNSPTTSPPQQKGGSGSREDRAGNKEHIRVRSSAERMTSPKSRSRTSQEPRQEVSHHHERKHRTRRDGHGHGHEPSSADRTAGHEQSKPPRRTSEKQSSGREPLRTPSPVLRPPSTDPLESPRRKALSGWNDRLRKEQEDANGSAEHHGSSDGGTSRARDPLRTPSPNPSLAESHDAPPHSSPQDWRHRPRSDVGIVDGYSPSAATPSRTPSPEYLDSPSTLSPSHYSSPLSVQSLSPSRSVSPLPLARNADHISTTTPQRAATWRASYFSPTRHHEPSTTEGPQVSASWRATPPEQTEYPYREKSGSPARSPPLSIASYTSNEGRLRRRNRSPHPFQESEITRDCRSRRRNPLPPQGFGIGRDPLDLNWEPLSQHAEEFSSLYDDVHSSPSLTSNSSSNVSSNVNSNTPSYLERQNPERLVHSSYGRAHADEEVDPDTFSRLPSDNTVGQEDAIFEQQLPTPNHTGQEVDSDTFPRLATIRMAEGQDGDPAEEESQLRASTHTGEAVDPDAFQHLRSSHTVEEEDANSSVEESQLRTSSHTGEEIDPETFSRLGSIHTVESRDATSSVEESLWRRCARADQDDDPDASPRLPSIHVAEEVNGIPDVVNPQLRTTAQSGHRETSPHRTRRTRRRKSPTSHMRREQEKYQEKKRYRIYRWYWRLFCFGPPPPTVTTLCPYGCL
ncbi:hypothetical protein EJ08DRAFT_655256 [Tothia fuscella]|uniref:Uncharacterized protein n=1 Tax=Tothia fuscella TaxID=1048955 RepID=A0A9P4U4X5_9PEZI|nr:hypothetical protein EJ08DRAFT_655256 [Tothia fuscella]